MQENYITKGERTGWKPARTSKRGELAWALAALGFAVCFTLCALLGLGDYQVALSFI